MVSSTKASQFVSTKRAPPWPLPALMQLVDLVKDERIRKPRIAQDELLEMAAEEVEVPV